MRIANPRDWGVVGMNNTGIIASINKYNKENTGGIILYDFLFSMGGLDNLKFDTSIKGVKISDNHYKYEDLKNPHD